MWSVFSELIAQFGVFFFWFLYLVCLGLVIVIIYNPEAEILEKPFIFLSTMQQILCTQRTKECLNQNKHNLENQCLYHASIPTLSKDYARGLFLLLLLSQFYHL